LSIRNSSRRESVRGGGIKTSGRARDDAFSLFFRKRLGANLNTLHAESAQSERSDKTRFFYGTKRQAAKIALEEWTGKLGRN